MASVSRGLRWAARFRATAALCLLGVVAGTGAYIGNLVYVKTVGAQQAAKPVATLSEGLAPGDGVNAVAFSADGGMLAAAYADGTLRLFNPAEAQLVVTLPTDGVAEYGVAFSPDGHLLAAGSGDGNLHLWNLATDKEKAYQSDGGSVNGVAFSPDGSLLATADTDGDVRLWDPATGGSALQPLFKGTTAAYGLAFSGDGKLLAAGFADGKVRLWNPASRLLVTTLAAGTAPVYAVAFSPRGNLLAAADGDGTVRLWHLGTFQPDGGPLSADTPRVYGVAFSSDGKFLASADDNGTVRLMLRKVGSLCSHHRVRVQSGVQPAGTLMATPTGTGQCGCGMSGSWRRLNSFEAARNNH